MRAQMKMLATGVLLMIAIAVVVIIYIAPLGAQDPLKVAPRNVKLLLENDRVRVLEARLKPGDKEPKHSHPTYLAYYLTPLKVKVTTPDGKSNIRERKAGEVAWTEPITHSTENVGTAEARVLIVELKESHGKQ